MITLSLAYVKSETSQSSPESLKLTSLSNVKNNRNRTID